MQCTDQAFFVQQISPGVVKTEFSARAHNDPGRVMAIGVDAKNIADAVVYILSTPPELQVRLSAAHVPLSLTA